MRLSRLSILKPNLIHEGGSKRSLTSDSIGMTNVLKNGGIRENAQKIASHKEVRTTALHDRRSDEVFLNKIEHIRP
ncbi:hypothetical protein PROH_08490 [Prochlorothrix hollandica PCC 9006 = CALU 1027]|uniref:Integrase n=1 Tax=Prochlorothrix hollandica PCC 9006 = CALU 1027 TaxID=317619 RepID=A0A0M2PTP0_PROHO|nr:hypothetical protein PROH_08490 [Prochlorothrix hollandica PCC 9006 = CALU 1027]